LGNIEGFRPIRASKGKSQRTDAMDKEPSGAGPPGSKSGPGAWQAMLPPAHWLRLYRPQWLARDAIAGVTLAPYGIPVSLAYASLAGLPPQYGALRAIWIVAPVGRRTDLRYLLARGCVGRGHGRRRSRTLGVHCDADRRAHGRHVQRIALMSVSRRWNSRLSFPVFDLVQHPVNRLNK
jgi:hypothetical protein